MKKRNYFFFALIAALELYTIELPFFLFSRSTFYQLSAPFAAARAVILLTGLIWEKIMKKKSID